MKQLLSIGLVLAALLSTGYAQSWQEEMDQMQERIQLRQKNQQTRLDLRYANQMRRLWIQMSLDKSPDAPLSPDPDVPRVYDPSGPMQLPGSEILITPENLGPESQIAQQPVMRKPEALPEIPAEVQSNLRNMNRQLQAEYFGTQVLMKYDSRMEFSLGSRITEDRIADVWEQLEKTEHEGFMYQLLRQGRSMHLNDWGLCQLINSTAKEMYPRDKNAQVLFSWFCLSKAGYISTVSYDREHLYLMVPAQQTLYGKVFLRGSAHKLYALDLDGAELDLDKARVFKQKYPDATRVLDLRLTETPQFRGKKQYKRLKMDYYGTSYSVPLAIDKNLIDFYKTYPFVDLEIYLSAPLSPDAQHSMVDSLRKIVARLQPRDGRSKQEEQVNFLLRFVQTSLAYQSDREQFGGEKYLFADETLYYPYSDCEDRAVLFAYLVREILQLEVVGLLYPGHAATAVHLPGPAKGDYLMHKGKRFYICDPTYINANYGVSLPDVKGQMPRVLAM
jgi:hypothetical protein